MHADEYLTREDTLAGWPVRVTSYRVGDLWHAHVENLDPGAKIARSSGPSREDAERTAVDRAAERLSRTRRHG